MRGVFILLALTVLAATAARADDGFDDSNTELQFRQCVDQSMRSTINMVAFQIMQKACLKLYRDPTVTGVEQRAYWACLLRSLQGVNNDIAVQQIAKACEEHRY
jgi:hypothetical protein